MLSHETAARSVAGGAAGRQISFSLKQTGPDTWSNVADKYAVETNTTGRITRAVETQAAEAVAAAAAPVGRKRKRPQLRGGLDY